MTMVPEGGEENTRNKLNGLIKEPPVEETHIYDVVVILLNLIYISVFPDTNTNLLLTPWQLVDVKK